MDKTIGFFGDSFCASRKSDSWCVILAEALGLDITHWGTGGASIWKTMMQFNSVIHKPDIIVFCWTETTRLFHRRLPLTPNAVPIPGEDPKVFEASSMYYKYLQDDDKDVLAGRYALQWFDQKELKQYERDHKIVQAWSFRTEGVALHTGRIIDQEMVKFAWGGDTPDSDYKNDLNMSNHMTSQKNQEWAKLIRAVL